MPSRLVREALLESDRWLALPDNSSRLAFLALILRADDFGNTEANPARLCRWWRDFGIDTKEKVATVLLSLSDSGLVRIYGHPDRPCLHIPRFGQRMRHYRRNIPVPPWQEQEYQAVIQKTADERKAGDGPTSGVRSLEVEVEVEEVRPSIGFSSVPAPPSAPPPKTPADKAKGTRLQPDWKLPDEWQLWSLAVRPDWTSHGVVRESLRFRDYWLGKAGNDGRKVDWYATWRNWLRRCEKEPAR